MCELIVHLFSNIYYIGLALMFGKNILEQYKINAQIRHFAEIFINWILFKSIYFINFIIKWFIYSISR